MGSTQSTQAVETVIAARVSEAVWGLSHACCLWRFDVSEVCCMLASFRTLLSCSLFCF